MKFCSKCGKEILEEAVICPHCGCAASPPSTFQSNADDQVSNGLCVLSFFIPLFGIIYWAVKYRETPKRAQACGVTALASWAVGIVFSAIYSAIIFSL